MILFLVANALILLNSVSAGTQICGSFGNNWSAEIRCLRSLLSQCWGGRSGPGRDVRSHPPFMRNEPHQSQQGPQNHWTPPQNTNQNDQPRHSFERIESWRQAEPPKPTTTARPTATVPAPPTFSCGECTRKLKDTMAKEMDSRLERTRNEFNDQIRELETRVQKALTNHSQQSDKEMRSLTKKVDLLTTRVYRFTDREYVFVNRKESWYHASEQCHLWGGKLASVASDEENLFISKILPNNTAAWIGYNDIQREQEFVNSDETSTNFTNWATGQPDNGNWNENCVLVHSNGQWSDEFCMIARDFLCKR
ncbi:unnamed protein product, partial [Mesorhabditis belari]|uniref:C-type lectin domain-containing protein n=1 Tax=Mesorhabditis belari TaxID=2138241 RepID=A0AAF3E9Y8_9BILA